MSIIQPAALLFGLLAIPILLLYMLRMRRKEQAVPSVLLWSMLLRDRRASTPWQRLRRNLLLLLQLLILASLVLAMVRPALPVAAVSGDSLIVLMDGSASMQAVDVSPNRFEHARRAVDELITNLAPTTSMSLVLVGDEPQVLAAASSDKAQLRVALARARAGIGPADWSSALALAAGVAAQASHGATIVIVSDGGLRGQTIPSLPAQVRYVPVGRSDDNLAISAMALQRTAAGTELFLQVHNYSTEDRQAVLALDIDGKLYQAERVVVAGGESLDRIWNDAPAEGRVYRARLGRVDAASDKTLDALPLDDVAFAVQRPSRERRALLFPYQAAPARYNVFIEKALLALDDFSSYRAVPAEGAGITPPEQPFELYVVDGVWPGTLPPGGLLLINPPDNPLIQVDGVSAVTAPVHVAEHSLTRYVSWQDVQVAKAKVVDPPAGSGILVEAGDLPLVFVSEVDGRRIAVVTFDLHESDLPLQVAFPILFSGLVGYLAPAQVLDDADLRPGRPLDINLASDVTQVAVTSPSGRIYQLEPSATGFRFTDTDELGLYLLEYRGTAAQEQDHFAVNLFEPGESSIRPAEAVNVASGVIGGGRSGDIGLRELWPWLVQAAVLILMVEWWIDHGRSILSMLNLRPRRPTGPEPKPASGRPR